MVSKGSLIEELRSLPDLWCSTLVRCSLQRLAEQYPDEIFRLLVLLGKDARALYLAAHSGDPLHRVKVQILIATTLRETGQAAASLQLLLSIHKAARALSDRWEQAVELQDLAVALAQQDAWTATEEAIASIAEERHQAEARRDFAITLAQKQAWAIARRVIASIPDEWHREQARCGLAAALAQKRDWAAAEQVIATLLDPRHRVTALSTLSGELARAGEQQAAELVLAEAMQALSAISDEWYRARAFSEIARALVSQQEPFLATMEPLLNSLVNQRYRVELAGELAALSAQQQEWSVTEHLLATISDQAYRARALRDVACVLARRGEWTTARRVIALLADAPNQIQALSILGQELARAGEQRSAQQVLSEIERLLASLIDDRQRARTAYDVACVLARQREWAAARRVIALLADTPNQIQALSTLGQELARAGEQRSAQQVLAEIEQALVSTIDDWQRVQALHDLVYVLTQQRAWAAAEYVIATMPRRHQAQALHHLALALARAGMHSEAARVLASIPDERLRAEALSRLAQESTGQRPARQVCTPTDQDPFTVEPILATELLSANAVNDPGQAQAGDDASTGQDWANAEQAIAALTDIWRRVAALRDLAATLAARKDYRSLLRLIERWWQRVDRLDEAVALLPLVYDFVALSPELGKAFADAFVQVDHFLRMRVLEQNREPGGNGCSRLRSGEPVPLSPQGGR